MSQTPSLNLQLWLPPQHVLGAAAARGGIPALEPASRLGDRRVKTEQKESPRAGFCIHVFMQGNAIGVRSRHDLIMRCLPMKSNTLTRPATFSQAKRCAAMCC